MATNTPKLNLVKPGLGDNVDVTELNGNMDILDDALVAATLEDLTDTDITAPANGEVLEYDGTNWVNAAGGKILQVANDITNTGTSTNSTSPVATDVSVTVTPNFASSKFVVFYSAQETVDPEPDTINRGCNLSLLVNGTSQGVFFRSRSAGLPNSAQIVVGASFNAVYSSGNTSPITFSVGINNLATSSTVEVRGRQVLVIQEVAV